MKSEVRYNSRNEPKESHIVQNKICMHFLINGRVQGVWFRASAQDEAKALNLTGWARNTENGDVEIIACGDKNDLSKFYAWLQQGPELGRVDNVSQKELPWQEFDRFYIK